jgi:hypothetical protein
MLTVEVPLNTMLADLDETLRGMLKSELERHGFEGIEIAFDAPSREWSGQLSAPAVSLFLYDMRESEEERPSGWTKQRIGDEFVEGPPPMVMEVSYAITAWAQAVEDEHRLLSQVLGILYSYRRLPAEVLESALDGGSVLAQAETSVGRPREEKADFWTSVGGQYKASIDFVVHTQVASGASYVRGPEVRTQTIRTRMSDGPARTLTEFHRIAGTVSDADGQAVPDAWVAIPSAGLWTATSSDGRFRFDRIQPGSYHVVARTAAGDESEATLEVPGGGVDLTIGAAGAGASTPRSRRRS